MDILLKIKKILIFVFSFVFFVNGHCNPPTTKVSKEVILGSIIIEGQEKERRQNLDEPNNDFSSAKCIDKSFANYIYPKNDLDFYQFSLKSGNLKVYILDYETLGSQYNIGFQIFDDQSNLIYDLNQRSFDSVNSVLSVNRNLNSNECLMELCPGLERYRYIGFTQTKLKFYIKFYALNEVNYKESFRNISADKITNPTNQTSFFNLTLQGDFAACL
ncbi:hypothetical protein LPTSP3_g24500 [Leptospira kobayashii]|uniref:Lipoprotein n=1 Tax=Leptospira kobayashii TaxID=1917830 RepID=A0ABM7UKY2_9LEPT|nr:hypothetical protein [Leptospira kobayashii]BDA79520.1 hypothetical protein LPTSP3_g24500 [Leptospira kobayashii]